MSMENLSSYKMTSRPCKKCGVIFSGARCLICWRAYSKDRRADEKYKKLEQSAADRYYQRNKEGVKNSTKINREKRKDHYRSLGRLSSQNRRAREKSAGGKLSKGLAERLFALQKGKCPCCGQHLGNDYHIDHKMPLALGGANSDDNIQLLRSVCNLKKHKMHPVDFMQKRGFLL